MLKRICSLFMALFIAVSLCSCNTKDNTHGNTDGTVSIDPDAPAHEQLMAQVEQYLITASRQSEVGMTLLSEYHYGLAQAEISSYRLCLDTLLWLLGEGESLAEVIGDTPYKDWNSIVGAGIGSGTPFYFEGLLLTFQGKNDDAENCYRKAKANPSYTEHDFFYLRNMSVDELYELKKEVVSIEKKVQDVFTPRTVLVAERTGAEFSAEYHLALAQAATDPSIAQQCAINALMANPTESALYSAATVYSMNAGDAALGCELVNEGLFLYPEDSMLNYLGAVLCLASGDNDAAQDFLLTAKVTADEDLMGRITALEGKIGG